MAQAQKPARLEARLNPDIHMMIKRAAEIEGRTVTDFVVAAASEAAKSTIERTHVIKLSQQDSEFIAKMLVDTPPIAPAMERSHENHSKLIGS